MYNYRSLETVPVGAQFTGGREKRPNQVEMLTTAVTEMAKATISQQSQDPAAPTGISPGKIANLRTNYLQQMRDIHSLFESGALNEKEFQEQKQPVLQQLKKLSQ